MESSIDVMLNDEEREFREEFRESLAGLDFSFVKRMDREGRKEFPEKFERKLGKNGYMGIPLPESVGGRGLNMASAVLGAEEAGAIAFPLVVP